MPILTVTTDLGNEFPLNYVVHGADSAEHKVLFIMGYGTSLAGWEHQTEYFRTVANVQFVVYDNRGVGDTGIPKERCTTKRMASDAVALVNHLTWTNFHVVAISMGGMIGLELITRIPLRVRSAALLVTTPGQPSGILGTPFDGLKGILKGMTLKEKPEVAANSFHLMFSDAWGELRPSREDVAARHATNKAWMEAWLLHRLENVQRPTLQGIMGHMLAVQTHRVSAKRLQVLAKYHVPLVLITGTVDRLVNSKHTHRLKRMLPHAKLVVYEGAGHAVHLERMDETHGELLRLWEHPDAELDAVTARPARAARE